MAYLREKESVCVRDFVLEARDFVSRRTGGGGAKEERVRGNEGCAVRLNWGKFGNLG